MIRVYKILKKSRLHGINRRFSPYILKIKRIKWIKARRKRMRYIGTLNSVRRSPISSVAKAYYRVQFIHRVTMYNRIYWRSIYPGVNVSRIRLNKNYELRDPCKDGESIRWMIESRLDVVLWRSGLVPNILLAKHVLKSGYVELYREGKWVTVTRPDMVIGGDMVLKVSKWSVNPFRRTLYGRLSMRCKHKVPAYRLVDYNNGIVTMTHKPKDGEVLLLTGIPIRVSSLCKRG
jgi:hypothetical protein